VSIPLSWYIVFATVLLCISIAGIFINRKNVIVLLMCIELMLLAVNTNFVAFSRFLPSVVPGEIGNPAGQVFVFFILTVAAAESAIGLAIVVLMFRNRRTINVGEIDTLRY
jgi:NADH-quinone oxidoreductase subunit K